MTEIDKILNIYLKPKSIVEEKKIRRKKCFGLKILFGLNILLVPYFFGKICF